MKKRTTRKSSLPPRLLRIIKKAMPDFAEKREAELEWSRTHDDNPNWMPPKKGDFMATYYNDSVDFYHNDKMSGEIYIGDMVKAFAAIYELGVADGAKAAKKHAE